MDYRLKRSVDFDKVFKKGKRAFSNSLTLVYFKTESLKAGFAVSKKHGKSVKRNRIKRLLRDGNSMRISRSIRDTAYQVLKTRGELEKQDKDASLENIASELNVAVSEVVYALDAISDTVSLYDPVYNKNGDELLLVDQIGDEKCTDENWTEKVAIDSAINVLGEREKKIIYLRYFEGKTQTEISTEIGISQAQVSRLEKTALSFIKNSITV